MAYEESLRSVTHEADASIGIYTGVPGMPGSLSPNSGKQFRFVKVTGTGEDDVRVGVCTAAAHEVPYGVLQNKPQRPGDAATVGFHGISMVETGAAITGDGTKGAKVDATGRIVDAVFGTDRVVCIPLKPANAAGQLVPAMLVLPAVYGVGA